MKIMIAEDDMVSRMALSKYMSSYGECDITIDGIETVEAYVISLDIGEPYDLICLDVMMPKIDGIRALKIIREIEEIRSIPKDSCVKVIITTALGETDHIKSALEPELVVYMNKPLEFEKIETAMKSLGLFHQ